MVSIETYQQPHVKTKNAMQGASWSLAANHAVAMTHTALQKRPPQIHPHYLHIKKGIYLPNLLKIQTQRSEYFLKPSFKIKCQQANMLPANKR